MSELTHGNHGLFINGQWEAAGGQTIPIVNPSTEVQIATIRLASETDVDRAVVAARAALPGWSAMEPTERARYLSRFADAIEVRRDEFASLVSRQNGMPISVATAIEGVFPAAVARYYANLIAEYPFTEQRSGLLGGMIEVRRTPVGVVAAIVPWNYPQSLGMFKVAPALAAGCTVVMKPSPETVLDSLLLAECALTAGLPRGVLNIVPADRQVSAYLVGHPNIDKVAFTGSTAAGRAIGERCGKLLRPVTLELGGKSAAIVLDDADLSTAHEALLSATLLNNGQTCFLGTRVLAPCRRYTEIVDLFTSMASSLKMGDALDPGTQLGPMVSAAQQRRVENYIQRGLDDGGTMTTSRGRAETKGWFVNPTVFSNVRPDHTIAREEIFGPVLAIIPYESDEEAVLIANNSDFGLGGTVWSSDHARALDIARKVETGTIGINHYLPDPAAPFGGIKGSGLGRELGPEGLASYMNLKSIYL